MSRRDWNAIDHLKGPAKIDAEKLLTRETVKDEEGKDTGEEVLAFKGSHGELVPVETATMLDWMTYYACNLMNPKVLVGVFLGAMATFVFCALTMKAVGRAAFGMVEEVRRQFREKPGIMEGTEKPDYKAPVAH